MDCRGSNSRNKQWGIWQIRILGDICRRHNLHKSKWWAIRWLYLPNIDVARYIGCIGYRRCLAGLMFDNASKPLCPNLEHGCTYLDCHSGGRSELKQVLAMIFLLKQMREITATNNPQATRNYLIHRGLTG